MNQELLAEKEKWDRYYDNLTLDSVINEDPAASRVYQEIAQAVTTILPTTANILEAGCGSGRHSLELSRYGYTNIHLLDFSPKAVASAQALFTHFGARAEVQVGDVFSGSSGAPEHELVFNSGVLEHYAFDDQVRFLKGMASFSRRYVLVLVPNRYCHWYWIYRLQIAANGAWPFGFEKPASSYHALMQAAGLHPLGKAYFAADAALWAIAAIDGLTPSLRELIGRAHQDAIIPIEQRSYMVGYLASVIANDTGPTSFCDNPEAQNAGDAADHCAAVAADTLANAIRQG